MNKGDGEMENMFWPVHIDVFVWECINIYVGRKGG